MMSPTNVSDMCRRHLSPSVNRLLVSHTTCHSLTHSTIKLNLPENRTRRTCHSLTRSVLVLVCCVPVHPTDRQSRSVCSGKSGIMGTVSPWRAWEREPITGVWGRAPSGVQGQSPGGSGGEARLKLKGFLTFGHPMEATNLPYSLLYMLQTQ